MMLRRPLSSSRHGLPLLASAAWLLLLLLWLASPSRKEDAAAISTPRYVPAIIWPVMAGRGRTLLAGLLSLDTPVRQLYIFDNSDGAPDVACALEEVTALVHAGAVPVANLTIVSQQRPPLWRFFGVSEMWNQLLQRSLMVDGHPWSLVLNDDVAFPPGSLAVGAAAVWRKHASHAFVSVYSGLPGQIPGNMFSAIAITRLGWAAVGPFDENLFPAYLEDCDWFHRVSLAGLAWAREEAWTFLHPVAGWVAPADSAYAHCLARHPGAEAAIKERQSAGRAVVSFVVDPANPLGLRAYYARKWGVDYCLKTAYRQPYGDVTRPLSYWHAPDMEGRARLIAAVEAQQAKAQQHQTQAKGKS